MGESSPLLPFLGRLGEFADLFYATTEESLPAVLVIDQLRELLTLAEGLKADAPVATTEFGEYGVDLLGELGTLCFRLGSLISAAEYYQSEWPENSEFWENGHDWICDEIQNAHLWSIIRLFHRGQGYLAVYADGELAAPLKKHRPTARTAKVIKAIRDGADNNALQDRFSWLSAQNARKIRERVERDQYES